MEDFVQVGWQRSRYRVPIVRTLSALRPLRRPGQLVLEMRDTSKYAVTRHLKFRR
jgi:hypothetical protein